VINEMTGNGSYLETKGACFSAPLSVSGLNVPVAVVPVAAAVWQLTDAVRPHVMAAQLKRTTDVFPSSTRGMDPPV
jgi:hypothetical protein